MRIAHDVVRIESFLAGVGEAFPGLAMRGMSEIVLAAASKKRPNGAPYTPNAERGLLIYELIRLFGLASYLEIGTSRGYSVLCAARAFSDSGVEHPTIVTIDRDGDVQAAAKAVLSTFPREWCDGKVKMITGESAVHLPACGGDYDLVYVDGSHEYADVKADGRWALAHAKRFVLFDDYNPRVWPGVVKACDELSRERPDLSWVMVDCDRRLYEPELIHWQPEDLHGMLLARLPMVSGRTLAAKSVQYGQ